MRMMTSFPHRGGCTLEYNYYAGAVVALGVMVANGFVPFIQRTSHNMTQNVFYVGLNRVTWVLLLRTLSFAILTGRLYWTNAQSTNLSTLDGWAVAIFFTSTFWSRLVYVESCITAQTTRPVSCTCWPLHPWTAACLFMLVELQLQDQTRLLSRLDEVVDLLTFVSKWWKTATRKKKIKYTTSKQALSLIVDKPNGCWIHLKARSVRFRTTPRIDVRFRTRPRTV